MDTLYFPRDVTYGSIFELERQDWWELSESGERSIPETPPFTFEIQRIQRVEETIQITAYLENHLDQAIELPVFPSPRIFITKLLETEGVILHKPRSVSGVPPPPHVLIVPSMSRVKFVNTIYLNDYQIIGNVKLEVKWQFLTWHSKDRISGLQVVNN